MDAPFLHAGAVDNSTRFQLTYGPSLRPVSIK